MKRKRQNPTKLAFPLAATVAFGVPTASLHLAQAQDATKEEATRMEKVVVTGSNLATEAGGETLTIAPMDLENDISLKGMPTVSDIMRVKAPQYAGGTGAINPGFGNGGNGSSGVSLRGLPSNATLLLVNGKRTSTSDLNLIPEAAIERVEILQDGASSIYGSDAVAGVVNVILKKEYQGLKLGSYYANTTENDISHWKVSAMAGTTTEKTKVMASVEYSKANTQFSIDRERSRPQGNAVSSTSNPGMFNISSVPAGNVALRWSLNPAYTRGLTNVSQIPAGFNPVAYAPIPAGQSANTARLNAEAAANAALPANSPVRYGVSPSLVPGMDPGFPYPYYTYAYRPSEKYAGYLAAEQRIFEDNLVFYFDGYYAANFSQNALAPSPLSGYTLPADNYWAQTVFPGITDNMTFRYRPVELGPRITYSDFANFHQVAGLKGQIAKSEWNWDTSFLYDRTEINTKQTGGVLTDVYNNMLGMTTAGAWNPFGYTPIGGTSVVNPPPTLNQVGGYATEREIIDTASWNANVNGKVVELPGGKLMLNVGTEYRREKDDYQPDYAIINGSVSPFNTAYPLYGIRDSWAGYAEANIPIFGEDFKIPAFHSFLFSAAVRYEDYSDVGDTGAVPRFSFNWKPIDKQVTFRGSYSEGFIAPGFGSLYQLPGQDFTELYNPYTGLREQPEDAVLVIGNPELKPSTAQSWLIGTVLEPNFIKGFSLAFDYYSIKQEGIPFSSAQYIVNQWYGYNPLNANDPTNPWGPNAGPSAANPLGSQVIQTTAGDLKQITNVGPVNTGERFTDGLDFSLTQRFDTSVGTFTLGGMATRILSWEQEDFPGGGSIDYLGRYWASGAALSDAGFPEWKANVTLTYEYQRFSGAVAWNFVSGYEEDSSLQNFVDMPDSPAAPRDVSDYQTFDLRVGYMIPKIEAELVAGVNNLLDAAPPLVESSFENSYDRRQADIRGRMYFLMLTKEF